MIRPATSILATAKPAHLVVVSWGVVISAVGDMGGEHSESVPLMHHVVVGRVDVDHCNSGRASNTNARKR